MTKPDYTKLDAAILAAVAKPDVRTQLEVTVAVRGPLADVSSGQVDRNGTPRPRYRVLEGRLQALRRAGKIEYGSKTGWSIPAVRQPKEDALPPGWTKEKLINARVHFSGVNGGDGTPWVEMNYLVFCAILREVHAGALAAEGQEQKQERSGDEHRS